MGRPRSFDWEEARKLRADGMTYRAIAAALVVSEMAVVRACNDESRARADERARRLRTPCGGGCGRLVWKHGTKTCRSGLCVQCHGKSRKVERHGTESEYGYGCRCGLCRVAATEARRRRRRAKAAA